MRIASFQISDIISGIKVNNQDEIRISLFTQKLGEQTDLTFNSESKELISPNNIFNTSIKDFYDLLITFSEQVSINEKKDLPFMLTTCNGKIPFPTIRELSNEKAKIIGVQCFLFDYDGKITREYNQNRLRDFAYISYNSYSHGTEACKLMNKHRMILFSDRIISIEEFKLIKPILQMMFLGCDNCSFNINHKIYLPALYEGIRNPDVKYHAGRYVNVDKLIEYGKELKQAKENIKLLDYENDRFKNCVSTEVFDEEKQKIKLEKEVYAVQTQKYNNTTHNSIYCAVHNLLEAGIDSSTIYGSLISLEGKNPSNKGKVQSSLNELSGVSINPYYYKTDKTMLINNINKEINKLNSTENNNENSIHLNMKEHISDKIELFIDKLNKDIVYFNCPTKSGKSTFAINELPKLFPDDTIIIAEPLTSIIDNLSKDSINKVYQDYCFNEDKIQICTYNALVDKYKHDYFKNTILVVDESHTLVTDMNFKYEVINEMINIIPFFKKVIYLSGTPIYTTALGDNIEYINFKFIDKPKDNITVVDCLDSKSKKSFVLSKLKKDGLNMIYVNSKKDNNMWDDYLSDFGFECLIVNAETKNFEDCKHLTINSEIKDKYNVIICTSYIQIGLGITNHIDNIFILSEIHPKIIRQLVDRDNRNFESNEMKNIYLLYKEKYGTGVFYNYEKAKYEMFEILEQEIINKTDAKKEYNKAVDLLTNIKDKYITSNNLLLKENILNFTFDINEIGIDYQIFYEETNYLYQNTFALAKQLNQQNFLINRISHNGTIDSKTQTMLNEKSKNYNQMKKEKNEKIYDAFVNKDELMDIQSSMVTWEGVEFPKKMLYELESYFKTIFDISKSKKIAYKILYDSELDYKTIEHSISVLIQTLIRDGKLKEVPNVEYVKFNKEIYNKIDFNKPYKSSELIDIINKVFKMRISKSNLHKELPKALYILTIFFKYEKKQSFKNKREYQYFITGFSNYDNDDYLNIFVNH